MKDAYGSHCSDSLNLLLEVSIIHLFFCHLNSLDIHLLVEPSTTS